jgi:hypothetical protein
MLGQYNIDKCHNPVVAIKEMAAVMEVALQWGFPQSVPPHRGQRLKRKKKRKM